MIDLLLLIELSIDPIQDQLADLHQTHQVDSHQMHQIHQVDSHQILQVDLRQVLQIDHLIKKSIVNEYILN